MLSFTRRRGVAAPPRRRAEDSIRHLATHDTLTGLPNRAQFIEALGRAVREAQLAARQLALLFVDLDHFKAINDTLGHDAGDALLVRLATAMRAVLRPDDLLARLGGDEFVVLLRDPVGHHEPPGRSEGASRSAHARQMADQAAVVARKLLAAATRPIPLKGRECRVSASIGICIFPDHANDEASLMMGADIAMYEAKRDGRNGFRYFSVGPV
jgi:GGDEF domain-containing protein